MLYEAKNEKALCNIFTCSDNVNCEWFVVNPFRNDTKNNYIITATLFVIYSDILPHFYSVILKYPSPCADAYTTARNWYKYVLYILDPQTPANTWKYHLYVV